MSCCNLASGTVCSCNPFTRSLAASSSVATVLGHKVQTTQLKLMLKPKWQTDTDTISRMCKVHYRSGHRTVGCRRPVLPKLLCWVGASFDNGCQYLELQMQVQILPPISKTCFLSAKTALPAPRGTTTTWHCKDTRWQTTIARTIFRA